jgi:hypothetical protein
MYIESFPGASDFQALEGGPGDAFRWWGNQCQHYAEANRTDSTRVSLDCRIIPKRFWDAAEAAGTRERAEKARKFYHDGELGIGSYYYLESVDVSSSRE